MSPVRSLRRPPAPRGGPVVALPRSRRNVGWPAGWVLPLVALATLVFGVVGFTFANRAEFVGAREAASGQQRYLPGAPVYTSLDEVVFGRPLIFGVYRSELPGDLRAIAAYERATGKRIGIVHWYAKWGAWKRDFSRLDLETAAGRGYLPMITWEPWAAVPGDPQWSLQRAILSGRNDSYIRSWARGMAAYGQPVLLRFAHEMHDMTYPWAVGVNGNTEEDFLAAWRHVRRIFDAEGASNVQWVWNPNVLGEEPAAIHLAKYRALYPGDDLVDWVGLDIYNTGPALDWGAPRWRSFFEIFDPPYEAATTVSTKPLIIAELASTEIGGAKDEWIRQAFEHSLALRYPRLRAVVWFDQPKEQPWHLTSSNPAFEAFVSVFRQSIFATGAP